jgi:hypothetical protein
MELVALDALGAPPERLEAMLERWTGHMLVPRRDTATFDGFLAEVGADGIDATVARHLPRLVEMPASEWFHSLIRLAYALDVAHPAQVASALTDWTTYGRPLPGDPPAGGASPAVELFEQLRTADLEPARGHADLASVAEQPPFQEQLAGVVVDDHLDDLAAAAAAAHVAGNNLATLHLVTGVQAARFVQRWVPAPSRRRFAGRMAQAVCAGHVAADAPALPSPAELDALRAAPVPPADAVRALAVASSDVHVTKLVYTCRVERAATGDPLYGWLAARAVELVA